MHNPQQHPSGPVQIGDTAPVFTLTDQTGLTVSLSDFLGKTALVLFFYPKDNTPGCTAEACAFRDHYGVFGEAGAEVIGISSDTTASHERFAGQHRLPFSLLSDPDGLVRSRFGVPRTLGLLPGRVTYLIDKQGVIRHIFSSQINIGGHITEALRILETLD